MNSFAKEARERNPPKAKANAQKWRNNNRDKISRTNRLNYEKDPGKGRQRAADWRKNNPQKAAKQWTLVPKGKRSEQYKRWRQKNLLAQQERRRANYQNNREQELAKAREYKARNKVSLSEKAAVYLRKSPEYNRFARSLRRAAEKTAMPSWANRKAMRAIYAEAVRLSDLTGVQHHVDHIVPLQSPWVCGLHCETNLRIIPFYENQSKSNRWWPDMPDLTGCFPDQLAA